MPRINAILGNGRLLVCETRNGTWTEFYYPYVGEYQNLNLLYAGLYYDGGLKWFTEDNWAIKQVYVQDTNIVKTEYVKPEFRVVCLDYVHPFHDYALRKFEVTNTSSVEKAAKLYLYEDLELQSLKYNDTAVYEKNPPSILHYKKDLYILFSGVPKFSSFACGETEIKGLKGTFVDAEDGKLEGRTVSHGNVDACLEWDLGKMAPKSTKTVNAVIAAGKDYFEVVELFRHIDVEFRQVEDELVRYWRSWLNKCKLQDAKKFSLYNRSLLIARMLTDNNGGIIASPDSESLKLTADTYNYVWWRDAAFVAMALDCSGLHKPVEQFFEFARKNQTKGGFFMHRHFPNGALGSTWHEPPFIQIDQTAAILYALAYHQRLLSDVEFSRSMWEMTKKAANFLVKFRDEETGLPLPSYDLWEERKAIFTYSAAAVCAGLKGAQYIADELGKGAGKKSWAAIAEEIKEAMREHLFDEDMGHFVRSIKPLDSTLDSSVLYALLFGVFDVEDSAVRRTIDAVERKLWVDGVGGYARYENDTYYGHMNPWIICTLWVAEAKLMQGDRKTCSDLLGWVAKQATPTGLLPEQVDRKTGQAASVQPLTWSHSAYVWLVNRMVETESGVAYTD